MAADVERIVEAPRIIEGVGVLEMAHATMQATGDTRVNLSAPHLISAASFTRRLRDLEAEHAGREFGEFWNDVFANGTAAIFASVAALESYANELFIDHKTVFPELKPEVMGKLWELYEQKPPLEKYEFALLLKTGGEFDRGASPYQDVVVLVKLRNGLIHFKPEWFREQEEHAKLSAQLRHRAMPSPLLPGVEPLFPRAWASHATCSWAVQSVLSFIISFEGQANIVGRMGKHREWFNAL